MYAAVRVALLAYLAVGSVSCRSDKKDRSFADRSTTNNKHVIKELITTMLDENGKVAGVLKTTAHYPDDNVDDSFILLNKIPFAIKRYLDNEINEDVLSNTDYPEVFDAGLAIPKHLLPKGQIAAIPNTLFSERTRHQHRARNVKRPREFKVSLPSSSRGRTARINKYDLRYAGHGGATSRGNKIHAGKGVRTPFFSSDNLRTYTPAHLQDATYYFPSVQDAINHFIASQGGYMIYPIPFVQRFANVQDNKNPFPILQQPRTPIFPSDNLRTYTPAYPQDANNYFPSVQDAINYFIASQGGYMIYPVPFAQRFANVQESKNPFPILQQPRTQIFPSDNVRTYTPAYPQDATNYFPSVQDAINHFIASQGGNVPVSVIQDPYILPCDTLCASNSLGFNPDTAYWVLLKCYQDCCAAYYGNHGYSKYNHNNDDEIYKNVYYDSGIDSTHEESREKILNNGKHFKCDEFNNCGINNGNNNNVKDEHEEFSDRQSSSNDNVSSKIGNDDYTDSKDESEDFSRAIGKDDNNDSNDGKEYLSDIISNNDLNKSDSKDDKEDFNEDNYDKRILKNNIFTTAGSSYDKKDVKYDYDNGSVYKDELKKEQPLNNEDYSAYSIYNDVKDKDSYKGDFVIDNIVLF